MARNAEWIQQLKETERKNQHQIGVLEKDLNDLKGRLNSEQRERDNVSSKLSDSERRGDSLRALTQKMEGELSSMDKKIRAEVELRRETEQEIERLKKQLEIQSIGLKGKGGLANGGVKTVQIWICKCKNYELLPFVRCAPRTGRIQRSRYVDMYFVNHAQLID